MTQKDLLWIADGHGHREDKPCGIFMFVLNQFEHRWLKMGSGVYHVDGSSEDARFQETKGYPR